MNIKLQTKSGLVYCKMKIVNIQEAKTHLSRHVEEVASLGIEIVIAKAGKPMARLAPLAVTRAPRKLGRFSGVETKESADCWASDGELESQFNDLPLYSVIKAEKAGETDRVAEDNE